MGELFIKKFGIPDVARDYLDIFFTDQEIRFVESMDKEVFTRSDIKNFISSNTDQFIKDSYRRAILSIVDEKEGTYRINDFYGRLDVFVVSETEKYHSIPKESRIKIDEWYFDTFYEGLDGDLSVRPTPDEILTIDEVLEFIDQQERPVYLNYCDCRSLSGDCGLPVRTCITYKNGINTFVHRGLSEKIDKERAKEIVRDADKKGLIHTVNPNGICNCCGDCCYLFRGQKRRGSSGFWPAARHIVEFDKTSCIHCGKCVKRCHFGVFSKEDGTIKPGISNCVGCGICATGCPTGSLKMKGRE